MKIEVALNLVTQAVAGFRGTFDDHKTLQEAMATISEAVAKANKPEEAKKEQK